MESARKSVASIIPRGQQHVRKTRFPQKSKRDAKSVGAECSSLASTSPTRYELSSVEQGINRHNGERSRLSRNICLPDQLEFKSTNQSLFGQHYQVGLAVAGAIIRILANAVERRGTSAHGQCRRAGPPPGRLCATSPGKNAS